MDTSQSPAAMDTYDALDSVLSYTCTDRVARSALSEFPDAEDSPKSQSSITSASRNEAEQLSPQADARNITPGFSGARLFGSERPHISEVEHSRVIYRHAPTIPVSQTSARLVALAAERDITPSQAVTSLLSGGDPLRRFFTSDQVGIVERALPRVQVMFLDIIQAVHKRLPEESDLELFRQRDAQALTGALQGLKHQDDLSHVLRCFQYRWMQEYIGSHTVGATSSTAPRYLASIDIPTINIRLDRDIPEPGFEKLSRLSDLPHLINVIFHQAERTKLTSRAHIIDNYKESKNNAPINQDVLMRVIRHIISRYSISSREFLDLLFTSSTDVYSCYCGTGQRMPHYTLHQGCSFCAWYNREFSINGTKGHHVTFR